MKRILLIAGTRPNFIKLAPLYNSLLASGAYKTYICHTGQHFDFNMSDIFWQNLQLPKPDFQLNIQGKGVADTIGKTILGLVEVLNENTFDLIVVFGDVNATAAGAITGAQSQTKVMHVEAGLRSFDRAMPEELNRIMTDHLSDFLMVSEPSGIANLKREGIAAEKTFFVGNIMIENLIKTRSQWEKMNVGDRIDPERFSNYVVATFHRPENVDRPETMQKVVDHLAQIAAWMPVVFPVHPRTKSRLQQFNLLAKLENDKNIILAEPLGYFEFLKLVSRAALVVTDSGGIQEETSFLRIPCVTFRKNTERPVTVEQGTNVLLSLHDDEVVQKIKDHIDCISRKNLQEISLWDDQVSHRIVAVIEQVIGK